MDLPQDNCDSSQASANNNQLEEIKKTFKSNTMTIKEVSDQIKKERDHVKMLYIHSKRKETDLRGEINEFDEQIDEFNHILTRSDNENNNSVSEEVPYDENLNNINERNQVIVEVMENLEKDKVKLLNELNSLKTERNQYKMFLFKSKNN